ncbi:hypothetical protein DPMN_092770 [Dreissena polymorpha]|uniref:Uncharacterized protein n=1 Tax=Dreissena polymorpha TaxID=45954 RepID=A0A9D4L2Z3_DREPO|nr:hypothetical protein DPMN_092770 [Dreissena polymorpha]
MTLLGYGDGIRRGRFEKNRTWDILINARFVAVTSITAGSKAEGLTCFKESDYDRLFVPKKCPLC